MAKCNLLVLLDEPERVYFPGDDIKGHVQVETDSECKCKSLDVVFQVSTSGKGNRATVTLDKTQEFVGTWFGQAKHRYPFSFRVPDDARPYHGTLLNVSYQVHARADIPWAIDPKDDATVNITYPNETTLDYGWDEEKVKKNANPGCFYAVLTVFLFSLVVLALGVTEEPGILAPTLMFVLFTGIVAVFLGRGWMATKRLGSVELGFQTGTGGGYRVVEDKDAFFVVVKVDSAKAVTTMTANLKVMERVVRGSGSNRRTFTHPLFESDVTLEKAEEGVYRGRIVLPAQGECPPSITFRDNRVVWEVFTRVDIPNWPDWTKRVDLLVSPKRNAG